MGWRIGYVIAHEKIIEAINSFQSHTSVIPHYFSNCGARSIEKGNKTSKFVKILKRRDIAINYCGLFKISYKLPTGAFIFHQCSKIEQNTIKFCEYLLEKDWLWFGRCFGSPGFIRLSFSPSTSKLLKV